MARFLTDHQKRFFAVMMALCASGAVTNAIRDQGADWHPPDSAQPQPEKIRDVYFIATEFQFLEGEIIARYQPDNRPRVVLLRPDPDEAMEDMQNVLKGGMFKRITIITHGDQNRTYLGGKKKHPISVQHILHGMQEVGVQAESLYLSGCDLTGSMTLPEFLAIGQQQKMLGFPVSLSASLSYARASSPDGPFATGLFIRFVNGEPELDMSTWSTAEDIASLIGQSAATWHRSFLFRDYIAMRGICATEDTGGCLELKEKVRRESELEQLWRDLVTKKNQLGLQELARQPLAVRREIAGAFPLEKFFDPEAPLTQKLYDWVSKHGGEILASPDSGLQDEIRPMLIKFMELLSDVPEYHLLEAYLTLAVVAEVGSSIHDYAIKAGLDLASGPFLRATLNPDTEHVVEFNAGAYLKELAERSHEPKGVYRLAAQLLQKETLPYNPNQASMIAALIELGNESGVDAKTVNGFLKKLKNQLVDKDASPDDKKASLNNRTEVYRALLQHIDNQKIQEMLLSAVAETGGAIAKKLHDAEGVGLGKIPEDGQWTRADGMQEILEKITEDKTDVPRALVQFADRIDVSEAVDSATRVILKASAISLIEDANRENPAAGRDLMLTKYYEPRLRAELFRDQHDFPDNSKGQFYDYVIKGFDDSPTIRRLVTEAKNAWETNQKLKAQKIQNSLKIERLFDHAQSVTMAEDASILTLVTSVHLYNGQDIPVFMHQRSLQRAPAAINFSAGHYFTIPYNKGDGRDWVVGTGAVDIEGLVKRTAEEPILPEGQIVAYKTTWDEDSETFYTPVLACHNGTAAELAMVAPQKPTRMVVCGIAIGSSEVMLKHPGNN